MVSFTISLFIVTSCFKLAFLPAYKSTDFEVHRNWLAITSQLPPSQWYHEATSKWTLDYPPLFAAFEWVLSWPVLLLTPEALRLSSQPYDSWTFTIVHRTTVVLADGMLLFGSQAIAAAVIRTRTLIGTAMFSRQVLTCVLFLHPGLLIVDHVHFQYNGFLLGVLFSCLAGLIWVGVLYP
jgi:alpha-1,3-glucosyltransferase